MVLEDKTLASSLGINLELQTLKWVGRMGLKIRISSDALNYINLDNKAPSEFVWNLHRKDRVFSVFQNDALKLIYGPVVEEDFFFFPETTRRTTKSPGRIIAYSPELEVRLETVKGCQVTPPTVYLTSDINERIGEQVLGFVRLSGQESEDYVKRYEGKEGSQLIRVLKDGENVFVCGPIKEGSLYLSGE